MTDLLFVDVAGRLASQLLRLAQRYGRPVGDTLYVEHNLTQDELAQLIGTSRESVNKNLSQFTDRGWIKPRLKGLVITDASALRRRARYTTFKEITQ